ncbi:MAG: hypothetical protein ACT4QG_11445 [Sporichthyaceae bacterium]
MAVLTEEVRPGVGRRPVPPLAPWIYENTKVYDPKGDYQRAGVPGPYFRGLWP